MGTEDKSTTTSDEVKVTDVNTGLVSNSANTTQQTEASKPLDLDFSVKAKKDKANLEDDFNLDELEENDNIEPKEGGNHVRIVNMEIVEFNDEGGKALDVTYEEDGTQLTFRHRMFAPKYPKDLRDDNERKLAMNNIRMFKHFFNALYPKGQEVQGVVWGNDVKFEDFVKNLAKGIDPNYKQLKAKLKLVYGKGKSMVGIPNFPPFIITSNSNKPKDFVYAPGYDNLTPQRKEAQEESTSNAGGASTTNKDNWL